jgi:hypothetical protein
VKGRVADCRVCRHRPAAIRGTGYCFDCWPGGPVVPPPCLRCGARRGYYTAGLCSGCHPLAPQRLDGCRDCHAWGATRTRKWLCKGCEHWRAHHAEGDCVSCRRTLPLDAGGACRLCRKQRTRMLGILGPWPPLSLPEANRRPAAVPGRHVPYWPRAEREGIEATTSPQPDRSRSGPPATASSSCSSGRAISTPVAVTASRHSPTRSSPRPCTTLRVSTRPATAGRPRRPIPSSAASASCSPRSPPSAPRSERAK